MAKAVKVGVGTDYEREVPLGQLRHFVEKYTADPVEFVVYKLSYSGKHLYIKGKSLAGSLVVLVNTFNMVTLENIDSKYKGDMYVHMYRHLLEFPGGRFRVKIIAKVDEQNDFYSLLKQEQMLLDMDRFNPCCLNNHFEAYIPQYKEATDSYGWIPRTAVMNFKKWLSSKERKDYADQYKK